MASTCYCVQLNQKCGEYGYCDVCPMKEKRVEDNVNNPKHYTIGKIEVFDFIQAWDLSFPEGNVVKYVVRAPYKGKEVQDLKKARWYLDQLIKHAEERNG